MSKKRVTMARVRLLETLVVSFILLATLFAVKSTQILPANAVDGASVEVLPTPLEYGPENVTGQEFVIKVYVQNVTDLFGIDIKFAWNPTYLLYLNHTAHIPVDTYPDGILHPGVPIRNQVNATAGTYWLAYSTMDNPPFDGSGVAFDMAFRIIKQPTAPEPDITLTLDITSSALSDSLGDPITHERNDGTVTIHTIPYEYPPKPLLTVMPETITISTGEQFSSDVYIMGEGGVDLDPFWDVAGFDAYMHFSRTESPYTIMEALDVTIDPDGTFAAFWPGDIIEIAKTINNAEGWVHVTFLGLPDTNGNHTAPYGNFRVFTVTFNATYDGPQMTANITLQNPKGFVHRMYLDADAGLIDLSSPVGTDWTAIDSVDYETPYNLYAWTDADGNTELSAGDEILLNGTDSGIWHCYEVYDLKGTLELTQQPFLALDDYIWTMDIPATGLSNNHLPGTTTGGGTSAAYNGYGNPYWTGNFTLYYPFVSVNSITVHALPFSDDEYTYTLTEGVDYIVYPDEDKIELLHPLDVNITDEHWVDGVNNTLNGWPAINYVASGIQSVDVDKHDGAGRLSSPNAGFENSPPGDWWYEPEWPWELEGWWALGYYTSPYNWPDGSEWWINYTAASYITVNYNAEPDPRPYYLEFSGSYAEFLALGDPIGTTWKEVYPNTMHTWNCTDWTDTDTSGNVTAGDYVAFIGTVGNRTYLVNQLSTDIIVDQIRTVEDKDQTSPFYGMPLIIELAGYPHPERAVSPWHNSESSVPIPHDVENAEAVIPEFPAPFTLVLFLVAAAALILITKPKSSKFEK